MTDTPIIFTVYLGSSGHTRPVFRDAAQRLGRRLAEEKCRLVYGGMDAGLMGLIAGSMLDHGGHVTGVIPQNLQDSERMAHNLSETILLDTLAERKKVMFQKADVILALPGGFGTADEMLEALFWKQEELHTKHIIFINIDGYYDAFLAYLKTLPDLNARHYDVVNDIDEIFTLIGDEGGDHDTGDQAYPDFEDDIINAADDLIYGDATLKNTYIAMCALGLKQLGKHDRHIGFLNDNGQFNDLLKWIDLAATERFLTADCVKLFSSADRLEDLKKKMNDQKQITIDLHQDKWGDSEI